MGIQQVKGEDDPTDYERCDPVYFVEVQDSDRIRYRAEEGDKDPASYFCSGGTSSKSVVIVFHNKGLFGELKL
jgi:hypothetical protein